MSRSETTTTASPTALKPHDAAAATPATGVQSVRKRKGHSNNTAAPSSKQKRLTRQLAGIMAHLEKHPHDALSQQRVATINNLLRQ